MQPGYVPARASQWRRHVLVALIALAALLLPGMPAQAIVGSTTEGAGGYAYVGAAWLLVNCCDDNGLPFEQPIPPCVPPEPWNPPDPETNPLLSGENRVRSTAILIAPNVALTEGAAYRNGRLVAVSFERSIADFGHSVDANCAKISGTETYYHPSANPDGTVFRGYVYHHPDLDRGNDSTFATSDIAVIILDHEVPNAGQPGGIPLSPLAPVGVLGDHQESQNTGLTAVSYGPHNHNSETWDFQRRTSAWQMTALEETTVRVKGPSYLVCDGDLGAPLVDQDGNVAALLYLKDPEFCDKKGVAFGFRIESERARDFLCDVGTKPLHSVKVNNKPGKPNLIAAAYAPVSAASKAKLESYCDGGAAAAAHHDGKQGAGRHHKGKRRH
jgi:hypothetical protein